jgi:hypothetical protein
MHPGARKLLTVCTRTRPHEGVLILTDTELAEQAGPLAIAATAFPLHSFASWYIIGGPQYRSMVCTLVRRVAWVQGSL